MLKQGRGDATLDVPSPREDEPEEPEVVRGVESPTLKTVEEEMDDPISDPSAAQETVIEVETVTEEAATGPAMDTAEATAPTEPEVPPPVKEAGGIHPGP
jgi:hypothetical protein